jgi:hypothetical protein
MWENVLFVRVRLVEPWGGGLFSQVSVGYRVKPSTKFVPEFTGMVV